MNELAQWHEVVEKWHDFFLMSGTAAVTLAGLLFVSISLHVEALVEDRREHLLQLARATLMSFVVVLVLSLSMLVPSMGRRANGIQFMVLGSVFVIYTVRVMIFAKGEGHEHFTMGRFRRRLILPAFGYAWLAASGWFLFRGTDPDDLSFVIGGITLLLGNALGTSWELLVRVARIRRHEAQALARAEGRSKDA